MKLLARLMSHGFSIALVVLLAIGFVYRGELFPEWELPDFLVIDSISKSDDMQLAGELESEPVQDDWMTPGTGSSAQDAIDAPVSPVDTAGTLPAVDPGTDALVVDAPAVEDAAISEASEMPVTAPAQEAADAMAGAAGTGDAAIAPVVDAPAETVTGATRPDVVVDEEPAGSDMPDAEPGDSGTDMQQAADVTAVVGGESSNVVHDEVSAAPVDALVEDRAMGQIATTAPLPGDADSTGTGSTSDPVTPPDPAAIEAAGIPAPAAPGGQEDEPVSSYRLLAAAREAYWLHDYQAAEDNYRKLISNDPDNPDGYGELANMYFSQGNWEAAAEAYYQAGSRLVKSGLLAPARDLASVIRGLNGSQADTLDNEIQAAGSEPR